MGPERDEIELLQAEMRQVRADLDEDVHDLVENARAAVDWRRYWHRYPWVGCAAALAAGYVLIPRRRVVKLDGKSFDPIVEIDAVPSVLAPARRAVAELGGMAVGIAAQGLLRLLARQIGQVIAARSRPADPYQNGSGASVNDYEQHPDQRCPSSEAGSGDSAQTSFAADG